MKNKNLGRAFTAALFLLATVSDTRATPLNYNPLLPAPAPVLDAGWASDAIFAADTDSADSPYVYALAGPATFSITDDFIVGDTFKVYDFGVLILTTSVGAGAPFPPTGGGDSAWESGIYSIGSVLLAAGPHSLTVQGDGVGGLPAGFWTRLDSVGASVPETGGTLLCLAIGLCGLGVLQRRLAAGNGGIAKQ